MKRLFVCCDGTWDSPTVLCDGVPVPSNVVKFHNCVVQGDVGDVNKPVRQLAFYHCGVGADETLLKKVFYGMTGKGLARNIQSAYHWLAEQYTPGDEIFVVGFSRGAFTARSLVGMLHHCGLLTPVNATWPLVEEAFRCYRLASAEEPQKIAFCRKYCHPQQVRIKFVGVWDTVGSLGIPVGLDWFHLFAGRFRFHDTSLSPLVDHACQALAIDEMRINFQPTLWTEHDAQHTDCQQHWFAGTHGDVGGGYKEVGLSDISLQWMIETASDCGAVFSLAMLKQIEPDYQGIVHDSLQGIYKVAGSQPRRFPYLCSAAVSASVAPLGGTGVSPVAGKENEFPLQDIHPAVLERYADPPITQSPYRPSFPLTPTALSVEVAVEAVEPWNWTGIFLQAGIAYTFEADGQWQDAGRVSGPDGTLGNIFQRLYGYLKRYRGAKWFCLVGAIADGRGAAVGADGRVQPLVMFPIGRGTTYTPQQSGYLYCFANDAHDFYWNNRGRVKLIVRWQGGPSRPANPRQATLIVPRPTRPSA
jgi:hypothetical protein